MNRLFSDVKLDGSETKYLLLSGYSELEDELIRLFTKDTEIIRKIKSGEISEFETEKKYGKAKLKIIHRQKIKLKDGNEKIFNIYAYGFGNPNAKKLNIRNAGLHGGESAAVLSQLYYLKKTLNPETKLAKRVFWKESYNAGIFCVDPFGYDSLSRLFFHGYTGDAERWPSDRDQPWMDININWERVLEDESKAAKEYYANLMKKYEDKLFLDHHETAFFAKDMRIPYDVSEFSLQEGMGTLAIICGEKIEGDIDIAKASVDFLYLYGSQPYLYLGFTNFLERNSIIRQLEFDKEVVPTDGIAKVHDDYIRLGAYSLDNFAKDLGARAVVYETFPKDLSKRVEEHLIVSEGAILEFMEYNPFKFNYPLHFVSKEFQGKRKTIMQPRIADLVRYNEFFPFSKRNPYFLYIRAFLLGLLFGPIVFMASCDINRKREKMFQQFAHDLEGLIKRGKVHFLPESVNEEIKKGKLEIGKILEKNVETLPKKLIIAEIDGKAWAITPTRIFEGIPTKLLKNRY